MLRVSVLAAICLVAMSVFTFAEDATPKSQNKGLWVWAAANIDTADARKELVAFCKKYGFNQISMHMQGKGRTIKQLDKWPLLIREATDNGIDVYALRGDREMALSENHGSTLAFLRSILEFNEQQPDKYRLKGIVYDIEPYILPEWGKGGEGKLKIQNDYLGYMRKASAVIEAFGQDFRLGADIPFWWDSPEQALEVGGKVRPFSECVQDIVDFVTLMSYRRDGKLVSKFVEAEVAYAAKIGKTANAAVETGELKGSEAKLSFWGVQADEFWKQVKVVEDLNKDKLGFGKLFVHHYDSLRKYLGEDK